MDEPSVSRSELWRQRLKKLRTGMRGVILFVLGVAAALVGLVIYNLMTPGPHQLTSNDVSTAVNSVLASSRLRSRERMERRMTAWAAGPLLTQTEISSPACMWLQMRLISR